MLTKIKRRSGLLVSLAVICATVAVVPMQNAGAAMSVLPNAGTAADPLVAPAQGEVYSACPGTTAPAAGFTDTTSTDVDCIKMFGITQGTTATTYEPDGNIPRWQMALYIHRMFTPTGMLAAGATAVPAFTDTSGLSAEIQAAITALASHGITTGTTATTFGPNDNVTREQMAMFLNRFASIATDHAGSGIVATAPSTGVFNYSDLSSATWEGVTSIIRLYNLGVTDDCTAAAPTGCDTTFRPQENITRAEMATMVKELLDHTNARPAGTTIQSAESFATAGSKTTLISVRNADFTNSVNTLVDEFFQLHQDGTAAVPVAAQTPFNTLGACNSSSVTKTGTQTLCTIDSLDKTTSVLGNVAGTSQTLANNTTANWWAWTGASGSLYNDGTTSTGYLLSAPLGTAAAATEFAAANSTTTISGAGALGFALPLDYNAYNAALTGNNGIATKAGASRVVTVQLKGANYATGATVVDGYTLKFSDKKVDMLGNVTISDSYVASSGGTASYTVTCGADNSALTTGAGNASSSYWEAHEITITEATAAGTAAGVSRPATSGAVTFAWSGDGQHNSTINISCDDATPTYTKGAASTAMSTSANNYPTSTAGALMSITANAYDQYGDGIAGQTTVIRKAKNGAGAAAQATLTTGADGSATLTAIVCATASGDQEIGWDIDDTAVTMQAIGVSTPTHLVDGTTVYCTTPLSQDGGFVSATSADQITLVTANQDLTAKGTFTLTVCSTNQTLWHTNPARTAGLAGATLCETTGSIDAIKANSAAACQAALRALNMLDANVTCALSANVVLTITYVANTGAYTTAVTTAGQTVAPALANDTATTYAVTQDGTGASTQGVAGLDLTYVDNDAANNTIVVKASYESSSPLGVAAADAVYHVVTYDDTDNFMLNAAATDVATTVQGATVTQFETEMASLTDIATKISGTQRNGALTSGLSVWQIGA